MTVVSFQNCRGFVLERPGTFVSWPKTLRSGPALVSKLINGSERTSFVSRKTLGKQVRIGENQKPLEITKAEVAEELTVDPPLNRRGKMTVSATEPRITR